MYFKEVKSVPIMKVTRQSSRDRIKLFDDFMKSGYKVAEVTDIPEGRNPQHLVTSLLGSVKHYGYAIDICRRKDKVYLVRRID